MLVRAFTSYFGLVNLAEDNERVRRIRARERKALPAPRRGSLREAIGIIAARGTSAESLQELLAQAEIRLVMTAHPTEARRRTTVAKLARVFAAIRELDDREVEAEELARMRGQLASTIQELWSSDEIRAVSPTALDEVRAGLVYFHSTSARRGAAPLPRARRRRRRVTIPVPAPSFPRCCRSAPGSAATVTVTRTSPRR